MNHFPLNDTSTGTLGLLLSRKSGSAKAMTAPGPDPDEIDTILKAATRVPDHGKLAPWRFILFEAGARERMGELLVQCLLEDDPQASEERRLMERNRFMRAPLIIAVISRIREGIPIPEWEQVLSAGAVCQNIIIATHALGYVANWITEWCAYHPRVRERLGLKTGERIAGFLYVGRPALALEDRPRPEIGKIVSRFEG
ncbi:MAG TPA: nitroreductase [Rhizomicrobium sp.]|jgi:nitroreductase